MGKSSLGPKALEWRAHFDIRPAASSSYRYPTSPRPAMTMTQSQSPRELPSPWTKGNSYIIESTRRAHACCKSCEATIDVGRLRVGVVYQHCNGFVCVNWHHVECYPLVRSIPLGNLEGFDELDAAQQKIVTSYQLSDRILPEGRTCSA